MRQRKVDDGLFVGEVNVPDTPEEIHTWLTTRTFPEPGSWLDDARAVLKELSQLAKCDGYRPEDLKVLALLKAEIANFDICTPAYRERAAFKIGSLMREAEIRFAAQYVHTGRGTKRGAKKGTETAHGNTTEKAEDRAAIRAAFEAYQAGHPYHSRKACCEAVGERFGVSYKTVERAIK